MSLTTKNGKELFPIGIGTWDMGGGRSPDLSNDQACIDAIRYSLSLGQNHIDTAEMYGGGHTDEIVGKSIKGYKRENLFIADKIYKHSIQVGKV